MRKIFSALGLAAGLGAVFGLTWAWAGLPQGPVFSLICGALSGGAFVWCLLRRGPARP